MCSSCNSFIFASLFVAQYEEYRPHLIQHLVERKTVHWDTVIRQLTSQVPWIKIFDLRNPHFSCLRRYIK